MLYNIRMEFADLKKSLKTTVRACYHCYGDDEFVIARALSLICGLSEVLPEFNVTDREFQNSAELTEELMQLPVMSAYRIVVARGKPDVAAVSEYLKNPNPTSVLVLATYTPHDSWNRVTPPDFPVGAEPVVCNRLAIKYIYRFVRGITDGAGAQIDDRAIERLYARCGGYMTRINSEAKKLADYRAGAAITVEDVDSTVKPDTEFIVYELGDSIIAHNSARALEIVNGMAKNNDLTAAFTLLYNRFKRLFTAAVDPDGLNALGLKAYMITKLKAESAGIPKRRLKQLLDMLADADIGYKSGDISQYDALTDFVVRAAYGGHN